MTRPSDPRPALVVLGALAKHGQRVTSPLQGLGHDLRLAFAPIAHKLAVITAQAAGQTSPDSPDAHRWSPSTEDDLKSDGPRGGPLVAVADEGRDHLVRD